MTDGQEGDRDDDTLPSSRAHDRAAATPASGALGPTAVWANDDADETVQRAARARKGPPAPPASVGGRGAVVPDADSLRSPHRPREDDVVRVTRQPAPAPPSGGAPIAAGGAHAGARGRAARRALIVAVAALVVVGAAAVGIAAILG